MSFPSIPPEGEDVTSLSQASGSSKSPEIPQSILKTTEKSSSTVRSILKKKGEAEATVSSKKVSFSPKKEVISFEKYLDPLEDFDEDHEGEEDDIDEETMKNTSLNENEGSRVQLHKDFFIVPESNERRSFEKAEKVYKKLPPLSQRDHGVPSDISSSPSTFSMEDKVSQASVEESRGVIKDSEISSAEEAEVSSSGMRIGGVFRRITTGLNNIGERIRNLLRRIASALSDCWASIRSNWRNNGSEVILISVNYNPNISSSSLETLSD